MCSLLIALFDIDTSECTSTITITIVKSVVGCCRCLSRGGRWWFGVDRQDIGGSWCKFWRVKCRRNITEQNDDVINSTLQQCITWHSPPPLHHLHNQKQILMNDDDDDTLPIANNSTGDHLTAAITISDCILIGSAKTAMFYSVCFASSSSTTYFNS